MVLATLTVQGLLPTFELGELFEIISLRAGFGDALIIAAIEKHMAGAARFVSWNARHFKGRLSIPSLTPREFLKET